MPLARSVSRFDLRYLDPSTGEWQEEWDTTGAETPNRLPRAVQLVLAILGPDPNDPDGVIERTYVRTVLLEMADELERSLLNSNSGSRSGKSLGR